MDKIVWNWLWEQWYCVSVNDRLNVQFCIQIISNAIQQSPAWEVYGSSRRQEIICILCNPKVHYLSQLPYPEPDASNRAIPFGFFSICITGFQRGYLGTLRFRESTRRVRQNADEVLGVVCCRNYLYRFISVIVFSSEWGNISNMCVTFGWGVMRKETVALFATVSKHLVWIRIFAIQCGKPKHRNKPTRWSRSQISTIAHYIDAFIKTASSVTLRNWHNNLYCFVDWPNSREVLLLDHLPKNQQKTNKQTKSTVYIPPPPPSFFFYFAFIAKSETGVGFREIVQFGRGFNGKKFEKHWCRLTPLFLVPVLSLTLSSPFCSQNEFVFCMVLKK